MDEQVFDEKQKTFFHAAKIHRILENLETDVQKTMTDKKTPSVCILHAATVIRKERN